MCAIAGVAGATDTELVLRMIETQRHRGPDGAGLFTDEGAGVLLGHRRLAILDLSEAGRQPMTSRDDRWTIVLNGEVFNYVELRRELGGGFRTATDTEVLLEACAAWGVEKALERSIGMFAFALWDAREHELILARDRIGEKPLVYFWDGKALAFASELKALRPLHGGRLDPAAVDCYLALGYVPTPLAIFRNCRKLPPGHLLRLKNGALRVDRWWFPERAETMPERSRPERVVRLRSMMADAVRLRLRSDVPVALYLSGGIDSSVVAFECARQGARLDAFTVAFDGDDTDLAYAGQVAEGLGLPHQVLRVEGGGLKEELRGLFGHYDEPFADSSALPSFALARELAGRRYKVVLNGDGADEAFGGYPHYQYIGAKQAVKAAAAAVGLCDGRGAGSLGLYVQSKSAFRAAERTRLLNGNAAADSFGSVLASQSFLARERTSALKRALWTDRHLYLANDLTYKMDIALAAWGMEGRAPFLDHRILEWSQSLPSSELVRGNQKKVLLRAAYTGVLPAAVLDRPKHGFGAPVEAWLRGPLREIAAEAVPCPLLDPNRQRGLTGQRLWTLVAFSLWANHWRTSW